MPFKRSGVMSNAPRYQPGGTFFEAKDKNGLLFAELCSNCGHPNGKHDSYNCPTIAYSDFDLAHPELFERLKTGRGISNLEKLGGV